MSSQNEETQRMNNSNPYEEEYQDDFHSDSESSKIQNSDQQSDNEEMKNSGQQKSKNTHSQDERTSKNTPDKDDNTNTSKHSINNKENKEQKVRTRGKSKPEKIDKKSEKTKPVTGKSGIAEVDQNKQLESRKKSSTYKEDRKASSSKRMSSKARTKESEVTPNNETSPKSSLRRNDRDSAKKGGRPKSRRTDSGYSFRNKKSTPKPKGREGSGKSVYWYSSDESSESSTTDDEEDEERSRKIRPELTAEYWDMHKMVRFLRVGNPTVTLIALCALQDFNLEQETTQVSIVDLGSVGILLNLLKTNQTSCVVGSLKILRRLSKSRRVNNQIYRLKGINQIVECLKSNSVEIQSLAAATIGNFASFRKAYNAVKKCNGISILVNILRGSRDREPVNRYRRRYTEDQNDQTLCENACNALWSCSRCPKNIEAIREAGAVAILASLLKNHQSGATHSTVGIIQECSSDAAFRDELRKEGIIEDVVRLSKSGDNELKTLCAKAIFKCGDDIETQKLVHKHKGLDPMINVLKTFNQHSNKNLLGAAVGAIWKCASYKENMERLETLGTLGLLIRRLKEKQPPEVEANLIGALGAFAYCRQNIMNIYDDGVLYIAISKLDVTITSILINTARLLALCAHEDVPRREILTSDGVRLLWSLLKSPNHKVVASAAYGIAMCVSNAQESAEIVRSFVGGLEMVTKLLRSNKREVLINVCRMVINIGQDRENMSIMTDYDVVPLLVSLVYTDDEQLHQYVAEAIATCCNLEKNISTLSPTISPLADGLVAYEGLQAKRAAALALEKLSRDPQNCFVIHRHGALKHLMAMMASEDEDVQEAAARCIKNVRLNAIKSRGQ